jgi:hypothetical protein
MEELLMKDETITSKAIDAKTLIVSQGKTNTEASKLPSITSDKDAKTYSWTDYKKHRAESYKGVRVKRNIEDIIEINKITKYYKKYLLEQKKEIKHDASLKALSHMVKHQKLFETDEFSWEEIQADLDDVVHFIRGGLNKQTHFFDIEMVDHSLFQQLFPIQVIVQYLETINRSYGQPIYNKVLRFQTALMGIFMYHHLNADMRFNPKISTVDINIIDPFLRIKIREQNRADNRKYFNVFFNLKKFAFQLLELYFPNVTKRYVSKGEEMHRLSLLLVLHLFELGLFTAAEMQDFVNILLQKLENLIVLEKESYKDFSVPGKVAEDEVSHLKLYFYECKEIVAAICIQVAVLLNDQAFMESYPLFNKELSMTESPNKIKAWKRAYFSNAIVGNILNRIMTSYLFRFKERIDLDKNSTLENLFNLINDFVMLTMDVENDICYVSSKVVTQELIDFYFDQNTSALADSAKAICGTLTEFLDKLVCFNYEKERTFELELIDCLNKYLNEISSFSDGKERLKFKNLLGFQSSPHILLSILSALITKNSSRDVEKLCCTALVETCKGSTINQIFVMNKQATDHWEILYDKRKLLVVILQTSLFEGNFHLFYVHRSLMKRFLGYFNKSIDKNWGQVENSAAGLQKWFSDFKKETIDNRNPDGLDIMLRFYVNCRFLYDLINDTDWNYVNKFHNMDVQSTLALPMFHLFLEVIQDKDFLPKSTGEGGGYSFVPALEGMSSSDLNDFIEKKTTHGINESELRCAVFEVAMLTMKLLNKACTGLYPYWLYKYVSSLSHSILAKTEHLLSIPGYGLEWRRVLMLFYINFRIFPNNSVLTNRETEFSDDGKTERRVNKDHVDGTVINEIVKELELTKDIEKLWDSTTGDYKKNIIQYYLKGLFPLISKYIRGIYVVYSQDDNLWQLDESLKLLKRQLEKIAPILKDKFGISFSFEEEPIKLSMGNLASVFSNMNQVGPVAKLEGKNNNRKRIPEFEERICPLLTSIRDACEVFLSTIDRALSDAEGDIQKIKVLLDMKYHRNSPIYSTDRDKEPWNKNMKEFSEDPTLEIALATKAKKDTKQARSLMNTLMSVTGLYSSEHRYYVELMDIYQEKKIFYLSKSVDENIFLKFLQSRQTYADNFITFISRLVERYFGDITKTAVEKSDTDQAYRNTDNTIITFLQNEIIISIVQFFSKVVADCSSIRDSLYNSLTDQSKPDLVAAGEEMVSLFYFIMCHLQQIVANKTFVDSEFDLLCERYTQLAEFFKNLCENNCQKFKVFMGTFVPKVRGLPHLNEKGQDVAFDAYLRMDALLSNSDVWQTNQPVLQLKDTPENFEIFMTWTNFMTECVNGPCPQNQLRVYDYKTEILVGLIKRSVDNVDSSLYQMRHNICNLVDGLLEGNNPDVARHFASNFTFNEIFGIICSSIKRLYIYCLIDGDIEKYKELANKAYIAHRERKLRKKEREKKTQTLIDKEMAFFRFQESKLEDINKSGMNMVSSEHKKSLRREFTYDPRIINSQIMEYIEIDDYELIKRMYLRNNVFSNHVILQTVFKLNEFMMQFAESVAGFKICLHNVFGLMVNRYGKKEVPIYVLNKLGVHERKKTKQVDENIVLYMFLCQIISEIELLNPVTKQVNTVLFPLVPKTFFFTKATRLKFIRNASTTAMTMDMILKYQGFEIEMDDNLKTYRQYPRLYRMTSDDVFYSMKFVLWAIAFLLNLILIIYYKRDASQSEISLEGHIVLWTLAGILVLLSFIFLSAWFFALYRQKVKIVQADMKENEVVQGSRLAAWLQLYVNDTILEQVYPAYFAYFMVCSLLGIFVHPFFYSLLLLSVVVLSTTLNYVVKAITTHSGQLLLTVVMMLLVIYCYAILSAEFFFDKFNSNQADATFYNCTSMWDCILYVFNYGLRSGGGISDNTIPVDPMADNSGPYVAKFFFDVMFFMLINVISLNIIFGIIIDTFAELRQKNDEQGRPT